MSEKEIRLNVDIQCQPDDTTCGPTALHAVYDYWGDSLSLDDVIGQVTTLDSGGTFPTFLACHALERGYRVRLYTYNLQVLDPSWFAPGVTDLADRLVRQTEFKKDLRLQTATKGYLRFLELGGELRFENLNRKLIRAFLNSGIPLLSGLSSTYLYKNMREYGIDGVDDDIRGVPAGHFVVLCGYDPGLKTVTIADPYRRNPVAGQAYYPVEIDRVICAVMLGVLTYDASLIVVQPREHGKGKRPPSPSSKE